MTSLLPAITSITLSVSLTLGSSVVLAAPAEPAPPEPQPSGSGEVDTGVTEKEKGEAEKLSDQAIAEFSGKNYTGAVELFQKAYEIDPQPNYLFNIGRVYEEAGELEQAVEYYGKFVKQPGVDLDSREIALERLRVLRAIVEETKEKPQEGPKPEPEQVDPVPQPQPQPVDTDAQRKRRAMRLSGFGVLGVGAGALIGAAVVGSLAQGDRDKAFNRDEADHLAARQYYLDKSQTKALTADILYGVGGALLLTGVVLVAVGYSKPKTQRVALTPSFGPGGGSVELRLRF
ncbi:MAG: tetratricopeptide repeat protein [Enhygromyxa sp.]